MDINGLAIVLDKVTYLGRIKRIKGDNAHHVLAFKMYPNQVIFCFEIHFNGDTKPLILTGEEEEKLAEIRDRIIAKIDPSTIAYGAEK